MADHVEIKPDGSWVFHGEDSRMRDPEKNAIPNYHIWNPISQEFEYRTVYRVYCMNCGKEYGVTARQSVFVKAICDDCWTVEQPPDFIPMTPDEEYRWRMGLPDPK